MNSHPFMVIALFCVASGLSSENLIQAEWEPLSRLNIGTGELDIQFRITHEGVYSPGGLRVTDEGTLVLIPSTSYDRILTFSAGTWTRRPLPPGIPTETMGPGGNSSVSQQGFSGSAGRSYRILSDRIEYRDIAKKSQSYRPMFDPQKYDIPGGFVVESQRERKLFSGEYLPDGDFRIRDSAETKSWLSTRQGGFRIGDDGLLYRNGLLWSAVRPTDRPPGGRLFVGKLLSGHNLWVSGGVSDFERYVVISDAQSKTELVVDLPWASRDNGGADPVKFFCYGVGPWGEVYYLIAPPQIPSGKLTYSGDGAKMPVYKFDETKPAELVVVRNHLKYFGRLNADGVRLRKEPNTTADILATYPAKTGFRILGQGGKTETINGKTSDWTQVRMLDGKEGWVFGAFVHNLYDGPNGSPPPWPNVPDW